MVSLYTPIPHKLNSSNTDSDSHASKVSENRLHSAAAYLLFYRRRSDKPLGPQYLQDLVLEFRNPPAADEAEPAEESDSGEGRLGDPNGSLSKGSSSGLTGAAVGARPNGASLGADQRAGNSLMTSSANQTIEVEGTPVQYGPILPPHMRAKYKQYGDQGSSSWNFNTLETETAVADPDDAAGNLMDNVDDDGDADSMGNNMDWEDANEYSSMPGLSAGHNSPIHSSPILNDGFDDHAMYSSTHEHLDNALHLEDAGTFAQEGDPETVEIHPDPPTD